MSGMFASSLVNTSGAAQPAGLGGLMAVTQGLQSALQIFGGISAARSAGREARMEQAQADLAYQESQGEAEQRRREVRRFQSSQAAGYLSSGVTLEGSPLLVLQETADLGQQEVDAILRRGEAIRNLGYQRASITRSSGRNALIGGVGNAVIGGLSTYISGRRLGLFGGGSGGSRGTNNGPAPLPPSPSVLNDDSIPLRSWGY